MNAPRWMSLALCALSVPCFALDQNGNQQSDVWEMVFGVSGLPPTGDADGDGWSNAVESAAGTDPKNAASFPGVDYVYSGDVFTYLALLRSCALNVSYRLHSVLPCLSFSTPTV